ncbi:hypothetical protein NDU88_001719 [Pleurodeles waltl]|uniref:Uncharacterized protein n=1 Tax=Pleurodeles waltl TaxID=8319 RepID=A0AAV7NBJ5_PLEWA|nr:hypothetical protein NDU88_001719 [Pleurodeles waltl]
MPPGSLSPFDRSGIEESKWLTPEKGTGSGAQLEESSVSGVQRVEGSPNDMEQDAAMNDSVEENVGRKNQGTPETTHTVVGVQTGDTQSGDFEDASASGNPPQSRTSTKYGHKYGDPGVGEVREA